MGSVATGAISVKKSEKFSPASSFIEVVEYNPKENTLDVTFKSGSKFRYLQVSPVLYLSFKQSPTFDSFYSKAIKGNVQSVKLVDAGIGREKSSPLDKVKKERTLDAGIRKQQSRSTQPQRTPGTVARAFAGAR